MFFGKLKYQNSNFIFYLLHWLHEQSKDNFKLKFSTKLQAFRKIKQ